jgi:hypothetical protein
VDSAPRCVLFHLVVGNRYQPPGFFSVAGRILATNRGTGMHGTTVSENLKTVQETCSQVERNTSLGTDHGLAG